MVAVGATAAVPVAPALPPWQQSAWEKTDFWASASRAFLASLPAADSCKNLAIFMARLPAAAAAASLAAFVRAAAGEFAVAAAAFVAMKGKVTTA